MQRQQAYRYELKLNNKQTSVLRQCCGTARFAFNWGLAQQFSSLQDGVDFPNAIELHKRLVQLKQNQFAWMYQYSKCVPQEALRDLDRAWKNKQAGRAKTPRFKAKARSRDSFRLDGTIKVIGRHVKLPRLGQLRTKEHTGKLKGRIKSVTISREADRWFCSFSVKRNRSVQDKPVGKPIGIDLGVKTFMVSSDGRTAQAPKPLKGSLKRLQRLSRQLSRKRKGSNNRKKAGVRLARYHRRVKNIRQDFLHKLSSNLTKTKQVTCIEDLNVAGMLRNHKLARAISDLGWGEFTRQLNYKAVWYGSEIKTIDRWFPSSKMCSCCGFKLEKLDLSTRSWTCPECSTEHCRDHNASLNILMEGCGESLIDHYPEFQGNLRLWRSGKSDGDVSKDRRSRKQTPDANYVPFG